MSYECTSAAQRNYGQWLYEIIAPSGDVCGRGFTPEEAWNDSEVPDDDAGGYELVERRNSQR